MASACVRAVPLDGERLACLALAMVAIALSAVACSKRPGQSESPVASGPSLRAKNLILISIDALRPDHLGCYGYSRQTSSNIDALCREGWVFERAYCATPRTGPSVASLHTGMFPPDVGEWKVRTRSGTLAERLSARGYATAAAVDNANLSREFGYAQGFEVYRETWEEETGTELARTELITRVALEQLKRFEEEKRPFFLWLHYVNPHSPYTPPPELAKPFVDDPLWGRHPAILRTGSGFINSIRKDVYIQGQHRAAYYVAQYDGEIALADAHVGRVLEALRSLQSFDDTLVIVTADHGESLGEDGAYFKHGPALTEPNVRIPIIFWRAGSPAPPRRIETPVSIIDIAPTALDVLGLRPDAPEPSPTTPLFPGESLRSFIESGKGTRDPYLFMASRDFWAVRARDLKLIVKTRKRTEVPSEPYRLFDLGKDPGEQQNLFAVEQEAAQRLIRIIERRRMIQEEVADNPTGEYQRLSKEALESLRSLGYIR